MVIGEGISFNPDTRLEIDGPLWTNASPGSAFGAQTISLDLSSYQWVAAYLTETTGTKSGIWSIGIVDGSTNRVGLFYNARQYRSWNATATGIYFGGGLNSGSVTGSLANSNTSAIPWYVYGLREVKT